MENQEKELSQAELYREERKQRMAKASKKNAKKSPQAAKIGHIVGKTVGIVVAAALVLLLVFGCLNFFGVPQKVLTAAKIGDNRITVAKYNYYYMSAYISKYNQSAQYDSYGTGYGVMYTGYDSTKSPMEQEYPGTLDGYENPTWSDYFKEVALKDAQSYYIYSKLAREAGMTVTDEQQSSIETQVESLTTSAKEKDYSLNRFLTKQYGKGTDEKLLREVYEDYYLAYNYVNQKQEDITNAVTDEQIAEEFNNNLANYTTFSASMFTVAAEATTLDSNATDDEVAADKQTRMAAAKATADGLFAKVTTEASLVAEAKGYDSTLKDSTITLEDTTYTTVSSSFGAAVADWVYAAGRVAGDKAVVETNNGYVLIYLKTVPAKDTTKSVDVRHILIQFPSSTDSSGNTVEATSAQKAECKTKAESVYNEYLANPTEDNFAALAGTYSDDTGSNTNGGLYEDVGKGDMVTEFNDWIFDAARKPGDTGIVETTYGYHVMYYISNDNNEAWYDAVKTNIVDSAVTKFDSDTLAAEEYAIDEKASIVNWAAKSIEEVITQQYLSYSN